jgi:2-succinyl-6-hydroxy-2,4-cyclohexadiene-1-carboxylate synthase
MAPSLDHRVVGRGPRVVLLHGFTQTKDCWGSLAERLAAECQVVLVDAPGHGGSSGVEVGLWEGAGLVGDAGGPADYIGYSMGGRIVLHLALERPELVRRLVLVSATAGIDDLSERARRRSSDEALARRLEAVGVEQFVDEWLAQPLFAGLADDPRCLAARRSNTVTGLASSLRRCGTGQQESLWPRLSELAMPVLFVTGAHDAKFTHTAQRMAEAVGSNATLAGVDDAGHACHLEQPERFSEVVLDWLAPASP